MTHIWQSVRSGNWLTAARARGYSLILLAIAVIAMAGWIAISDGLIDRNGKPIGTDFSNVYAAGELTWQGRPADAYNPALQHAAEKATFGGREVPFFGWHYPPFFFAIAFLVAALPYAWGLALWLAASLAAYLTAIRSILPGGADLTFATLQAARSQRERQIQSSTRVNILASGPLIPTFAKVLAAKGCECWNRTTSLETLLIATAFPAVFVNIGHGQNGFLTAALLGGALQLLDRRPWIAGMLIGLLAYKPQFGVLIPIALLASQRWSSITAAVATIAALVAISFAALGAGVWHAFIESMNFTQTIVLEQGGTGWEKIQSIFSAARNWGADVKTAYAIQTALAVMLAASLAWLWHSHAAFELKASALATASLLATPYVLDYDLVVSAVAIAFFVRHGFARGFRDYEISLLASTWIVPLLSRGVAGATGIPLGLIVMLALYGFTLKRALRDRDSVKVSAPRIARA
jgi:hypothetical protein